MADLPTDAQKGEPPKLSAAAGSNLVEKEEARCNLGFVDQAIDPLETFHPDNQPSKVWLNPERIPKQSALKCEHCHQSLTFLLQFYLPIETQTDAYHRTIYIFCCRNGSCHSLLHGKDAFKILRCQLPEVNDYYLDDNADDNKELIDGAPTCFVCGQYSDSSCGYCKKVYYCGRDHQEYHWNLLSNPHKIDCRALQANSKAKPKPLDRCALLFPEFEIVSDQEPLADPAKEKEALAKAQQMLKQYNKEQKKLKKAGEVTDSPEDDWKEVDEIAGQLDKVFQKFQVVTSREPTQVLRFDTKSPLWVNSREILDETKVPNCELCGSKRQFEFQVMPQLVYYIEGDKLDHPIDWGTLAVYTCSKGCLPAKADGCSAYCPEFVYRQPANT